MVYEKFKYLIISIILSCYIKVNYVIIRGIDIPYKSNPSIMSQFLILVLDIYLTLRIWGSKLVKNSPKVEYKILYKTNVFCLLNNPGANISNLNLYQTPYHIGPQVGASLSKGPYIYLN